MIGEIDLLVGLANPGPQYARTRHNAGSWVIEQLVRQHGGSLRNESKYFGLYGQIRLAGKALKLLIPTTYMNASGKAVAAVASFYKIPPERIMVAHDELDLPPGVARFKQGGGHGGHNGLRDIISKLGNQRNFHRLRIGIGHPGHKDQVTGYVLGKAPAEQQTAIDAAVNEAVRALEILFSDGLAKATTRLHSFKG